MQENFTNPLLANDKLVSSLFLLFVDKVSLLNGNHEKVVGFFHQERLRLGQEDGSKKARS